MAQDFKNVFNGLNTQGLEKRVHEGIWYPATAWGIVRDRQLADAFLAHARGRMVHESVCFLKDLAKVPIYDTSIGSRQRAHFYQTYLRRGTGVYSAGGASLLLNLPGEMFDQADQLFAPPTGPLGQLKNRLVGPTGSMAVAEFLVLVAHEVADGLDCNDIIGTFWRSPDFLAIHAANLGHRQRIAAAAAQSKTPSRPQPVVRFR